MPGVDLSQFVTRAELQPLAEIRSMLREDLRGLHEGQTALATQMTGMEEAIVARMDEANHRTSTLEGRLDTLNLEVRAVDAVASKVLREGCHQREQHVVALTTLARVGALEDVNLAEADSLAASQQRPFLQRHAKKGIVGTALVGLGALLPHVWEGIHWLVHLFDKVPK